MDVPISIATGLGLRLLLVGIDKHGRVSPALLGLWEGVVVRYLTTKSTSPDHYLAYGLRLLLDLLFTGSLSRMTVTLVCTAIGMVVFEAAAPSPARWHRTKRERHHRPTHSMPPKIRAHRAPSASHLEQPPLHEPSSSPDEATRPRSLTPLFPPNRAPSPPSFFLEGSSEGNSTPPKHVHLPTPPATAVTDGYDDQEGSAESQHRLSTIEEMDTGNITPEEELKVDHPSLDAPNAPHSISTTQIPLPIPNIGTVRGAPVNWIPITLNEPSDGLRTPNAAQEELSDHGDSDKLRTPTAPTRQLSPLLPIRYLRPNFAGERSTQPVASGPAIPSTLDNSTTDILVPPAVQHAGFPILLALLTAPTTVVPSSAPEEPVPDDGVSAAESLQTQTNASTIVSARNPAVLYSRADLLRQQARDEEKERSRLAGELKIAESESRVRDAFLLRGEIKDSEARAKKLHERAAKRYYLCK